MKHVKLTKKQTLICFCFIFLQISLSVNRAFGRPGQIERFSLFDQTTGENLGEIVVDTIYQFSDFENRTLSIEAITYDRVGSIFFTISNANGVYTRTENRRPYELFNLEPTEGQVSITAEVYSESKRRGTLLETKIVNFTFSGVSTISSDTIRWSSLTDTRGDAIESRDFVVVEAGDYLLLDKDIQDNVARVKGVLVFGELSVEDNHTDISLIADWILVASGGQLTIGSESNPFSSHFELILSGNQEESFSLSDVIEETGQMISTSTRPSDRAMLEEIEDMIGNNNYNFLMAMGSDATISIHTDDVDKTSWTQLSQTSDRGSDILHFEDQTQWEVGDRIAVASTDFDLKQAEEFTITEVFESGSSVRLDRALEYMHFGEVQTYSNNERSWDMDMRGEVGRLTRKVKIRGDVAYDTSKPVNNQDDTYGGHIMIMNGGELYLSGVELEHMGQGGMLGRYPAHWHLLGDAEGQYIKHSSSHHAFNKGWTIHGTQNVLMENNVAYETISHGYFLEDGAEVNNRLINNLAINARRPNERDRVESDDNSPSGFWIENSENTFYGNHVAGSESNGFWFELRGINGSSRGLFNHLQSREGPSDFVNNTAHGAPNKLLGVAHGNLVLSEGHKGTESQPQAVDQDWFVDDLTLYKGDGEGIWVRGIGGIFNDVKMAEINEGTRLRFNQEVRNSLIVGRTSNIGNPEDGKERTLPGGDSNFTGHQLYDGPAGVVNVHFAGFTGPGDHPIDESNAVQKSVLHYVHNVSFASDTPFDKWLSMSRTSNAQKTESKGIIDLDGSLVDTHNAQLLSEPRESRSLYEAESTDFNDDWNAVINHDSFVSSLKFRDFDDDNADLTVTRSNGSSIDDFSIGGQQVMLFIGETYELDFTNAPESFQLYLSDLPYLSSVICELKGIGSDLQFELESGFYKPGTSGSELLNTEVSEVYSQAELEAATETVIFRKPSEGTVVLKLVAEMRHGWLFPQPHMTYNDVLIGGVLVNVSSSDLNSRMTSDPLLNAENELNEVTFYPNPVKTHFTLDRNIQGGIVHLISLDGKTVKSFETMSENVFDISNLEKGIYQLMIEVDGKKEFVNKMVVIK